MRTCREGSTRMSELLTIVQKAIDEKKGENPLLYEFHTLNPLIDQVVITSASNVRQVYAIADNIDFRAREAGYRVRSIEGGRDSRWVLVDLDSIVIHVFLDEEREVYKLEKLYADLPMQEFAL